MLAEELDRRERDEARRIRGVQGRRTGEPSVLNSLEEVIIQNININSNHI